MDSVGFYWYGVCTNKASEYELGSVEQVFWWSLRMEMDPENRKMWANDPDTAFKNLLDYLVFKLGE